MTPLAVRRLAAIFGVLAVALGALGAHALRDKFGEARYAEAWKTGALYHLAHALALLALSTLPRVSRVTVWCFVAGIILFSGSLYVLSLAHDLRWLGPVTPLGGLAFIVGWLALFADRKGQEKA